ncbi:MAG: GNAT family N-acetyltransferase [Actinobacteria bacterium]|nr:MAG: GNAT family N-acetyltransferase [Actinomycetota bacterium]
MIPPAELGELEAFRSLLAGQEQAEIGGALCTCLEATPGSALFNRALGLGLAEPATEAALDEIDAFFTGLGLAYGIPLSPAAQPAELPEWLEAHNFRRGYAWTKFARAPVPPPRPETDLRVVEIGADRADAFADVFVRAYGTPEVAGSLLERLPGSDGWRCFVAFDGGEPAATGALFVTRKVGWLGAGGTLPEFRRRGAQGALLAARIEAGREAGCETLVTETGEPKNGRAGGSYRNIVRAGFEPLYVRQNYLSSVEADTSGTRA